MMKKYKQYNVKIFVWNYIEVTVGAYDRIDAKRIAVTKAMEEQPKVTWMVDENTPIEVKET